jgi:hypothetical protein
VVKTFLIHADHAYTYFPFDLTGLNNSAANQVRCDPCVATMRFDPHPMAALTQATWAPSSNPVVNQEIWVIYYRNWTDTTNGIDIFNGYLSNKGNLGWGEAAKQLTPLDSLRLHIHGGQYSVSVEHRVNVWTSFAYHAPFAEGFTALPP